MKQKIERLRERLGGVTTPKMEGDNLAILLCSHFDNPDQEEDDTGWTPDAVAGMDEVLDAIHRHYADHIDALEARVGEQAPFAWTRKIEWHKPAHRAVMASVKLGSWLSAALDDPKVCAEMKADIREWFSAGEPMETLGQALEACRAKAEAAERTLAEAVEALRPFANATSIQFACGDDEIQMVLGYPVDQPTGANLNSLTHARAFITKMGEKSND